MRRVLKDREVEIVTDHLEARAPFGARACRCPQPAVEFDPEASARGTSSNRYGWSSRYAGGLHGPVCELIHSRTEMSEVHQVSEKWFRRIRKLRRIRDDQIGLDVVQRECIWTHELSADGHEHDV